MSVSKKNYTLAELQGRIESLERLVRQIAIASPVNPDNGTIEVDQVAHGFTQGQVIIYHAGTWKLLSPYLFYSLETFNSQRNQVDKLVGVVENVFGADQFIARVSGSGIMPVYQLDDNPDPIPDGATLYASELHAGYVSSRPNLSGIVVGYKLLDEIGAHIAPGRSTDAQIIHVAGTVAAPCFVNLDPLEIAEAVALGSEASPRIGFAILSAGGVTLVALSGTLLTDTYATPWAEGNLWLDPDDDGSAVTTEPVVPVTEEWRPLFVGRQIGQQLEIIPTMSAERLADLSDVDLVTTPPVADDTLKWDATDKRFKPGPGGLAGNADGPSVIARQVAGVGPVTAFMTDADDEVLMRVSGILVWDKVGLAQMEPRAAYSILANFTGSTEALTEEEAPDGTVLARVGSTMGFGSDPELGTAAGGLGYLKIHFAAGKHWELDATGKMTVYQTATSKVEILADSSIKFTWGSSNTLTIDPADVVGSSRVFKIREIDVCNSSGVAKKMQGIFTDMY